MMPVTFFSEPLAAEATEEEVPEAPAEAGASHLHEAHSP